MSQYLDFVDLKYRPSKDDLVCLFSFIPARGMSAREAAGRIAAESSNGTWTELTTLKEHIRRIRGRVFEISGDRVKIAYPIELFELGSAPQLMSSVAGNIFGMKALTGLRLEDIEFPEKYVSGFCGPQFGISGIRKIMKIKSRPITATVPKPKLGMNTKEYCSVARKIWRGGIDLVKMDENMTSQSFANFYETTEAILKIRDAVEKETGERKSYLANVTAETYEMIKRARFVKKCGGDFVMIDFLTAGFAAFQTLRNECQDLGLAIHVHRAFHSAFTRNKKHGMSMLALAKIVRLIGGDTLHIGTAVGKLVGKRDEVLTIEHEIEHDMEPSFKTRQHVLAQKWYGIKPVLAVSSGGLHPGLIPYVVDMLGPDIMVQAGGGVLGNPLGPESGAMALRQSIDATMAGISLEDYAESHKELRAALGKWGIKRPV
jgi:ribulose-bisphosphate carboxylase large chain